MFPILIPYRKLYDCFVTVLLLTSTPLDPTTCPWLRLLNVNWCQKQKKSLANIVTHMAPCRVVLFQRAIASFFRTNEQTYGRQVRTPRMKIMTTYTAGAGWVKTQQLIFVPISPVYLAPIFVKFFHNIFVVLQDFFFLLNTKFGSVSQTFNLLKGRHIKLGTNGHYCLRIK